MKTMHHLFISFLGFLFLAVSNTSSDRSTEKIWYKAINENYAYIPCEKGHFLMLKSEISNFDYQLFLEDLLTNKAYEKYKKARIDSLGWRSKLSFGEPYVSHYHSHPAYRHYPVVNITREGAELYCEWLTEKLREADGGKSGLVFRLPTHDEWLFAAKGGLELSTYAWGGPYLRNSKGCYLCNFAALGAENIARDSTGTLIVKRGIVSQTNGNEPVDITAPVKSYFPNGYGLYNMNGNVAEIVADRDVAAGGSWNDPGYDVRNESTKPYTGSGTTVGFRIVASVEPESLPWLKRKKG